MYTKFDVVSAKSYYMLQLFGLDHEKFDCVNIAH